MINNLLSIKHYQQLRKQKKTLKENSLHYFILRKAIAFSSVEFHTIRSDQSVYKTAQIQLYRMQITARTVNAVICMSKYQICLQSEWVFITECNTEC